MIDAFMALPAPASHLLFGAIGGLLYILRRRVANIRIDPDEYVARPIFGAVAAYVLTVMLGLPNHETSLFVGYFGVDVWDAFAARAEAALDTKLPLAGERKERK